jgi:hypothetical protein
LFTSIINTFVLASYNTLFTYASIVDNYIENVDNFFLLAGVQKESRPKVERPCLSGMK